METLEVPEALIDELNVFGEAHLFIAIKPYTDKILANQIDNILRGYYINDVSTVVEINETHADVLFFKNDEQVWLKPKS